MENPYVPPEAELRTGLDHAGTLPIFDRASSVFLTAIIALVGACVGQVASLVPMLVTGRAAIPENVSRLLWIWFAVTGFAVCCGLYGSYCSLRRASVANLSLPTFLLLYSVTARVENLQFGWPFQLHMGMVFGRVGIGLNLVGVGMIIWWLVIRNRETSRAGFSDQADRAPAG